MPFDDAAAACRSTFPVRMRIVGVNDPWPGPAVYLAAFDIDANEGRGEVWVTRQPEHAMIFASAQETLTTWRRHSKIRPLRPDNRPNRPLTAYTIEIEPC